MTEIKFIPALKYKWLTTFYDIIVRTVMPEKKFKNLLLVNADINDGDMVLDFGVGTATLSIMAYSRNNNADYTGVDIDANILKIAKRKIEAENAKINLIKYDGDKLPFSNKCFDKIISSLVLHHLTTDEKVEVFKEFKRVLKEDGEIHIADWGKASNKLMRLMFNVVQILDGYKTTNDNVQGKLMQIMKEAGFKKVEITDQINTALGTVEIFMIKQIDDKK